MGRFSETENLEIPGVTTSLREQILRAESPPAAISHLLWFNFQGESQRPASRERAVGMHRACRLGAWTVTLLPFPRRENRQVIPTLQ